jgi:hypothetical protein
VPLKTPTLEALTQEIKLVDKSLRDADTAKNDKKAKDKQDAATAEADKQAMAALTEALHALLQHLIEANRPKRIVRDVQGRVVGIEPVPE